MIISIERATSADAAALVKIEIAAFHYDAVLYPGIEPSGPPGYDSVEHMTRRIAEDECYKIVAEGQCVGGIVIFDMGQGHFHLDVFFIDPAYHNRGIGSKAMEFIEQTYPATRWTLDTPTWAVRNQHFYEKFGYVKTGERDDPDDTSLFTYEKKIVRDSSNSKG